MNNENIVNKKMKSKVHGIGINDANYSIGRMAEGKLKLCPYYHKWRSMLYRTTEKFQKKHPAYKGCTVCN